MYECIVSYKKIFDDSVILLKIIHVIVKRVHIIVEIILLTIVLFYLCSKINFIGAHMYRMFCEIEITFVCDYRSRKSLKNVKSARNEKHARGI